MALSVVYFRIMHRLGRPHYVWDEYLYSVREKVEVRVTVSVTVCVMLLCDHLFGIVISTSNCHPRGPGFDSRLYPRNFSGSIGSGTGSTQRREDNWVAT